MVIGGEAGYRLQCARRAGIALNDTVSTDLPDLEMTPHDDMLPDYEQATGLGSMPVGYYAIVDSAFRHARGFSTGAYRDRIADRYSRFSAVAATNPHASPHQRRGDPRQQREQPDARVSVYEAA